MHRIALIILVIIATAFGSAEAQRIIGEDTNIQMTVGDAAGKTLAQAFADGDLGTASFTKATLVFPGLPFVPVVVTDSLFPGDCGGTAFDLVTLAPLSAMNETGGGFSTLCEWVPDAASPGFGRYVAVGPIRANAGIDDWEYVGARSSRDLAVVPIFGIYPTKGGASFEEQQTQLTADTPSGQADSIATTLGLTAFPVGCSELAGESVLDDCLPDIWDVELHRCSATPFVACDEDGDCTTGTCGAIAEALLGNSCIAIRYVGATGAESTFAMHDITMINDAVDSGTAGTLTITPPLSEDLTGTGSTTTGDGFQKCMNESYIHPTFTAGAALGASIVTEIEESQWTKGGNLMTNGDFETDCTGIIWSGGTMTHSPYRTDLAINRTRSAIGGGCFADSVDLGDTFLSPTFTTLAGQSWVEGPIFHGNADVSMGATFLVVDEPGFFVRGTTIWAYKTASGYVDMPGGVLPPGVCQANCVIVQKTAGLEGSTTYRFGISITTAPTTSISFMLDEIHVAHTPIERQEMRFYPIIADDNTSPSIVILGDSFAGGVYADGIRAALTLYKGLCDPTVSSTLCDSAERARMDVDVFTSAFSLSGATVPSFNDGDGWGILKDIQPDYCIVLLGTNDMLQATGGAVGFEAALNLLANRATGPTRFCGRVIVAMTLPARSTPEFIDCSNVDTDNDCFARLMDSGWRNFRNP